MSSRKRNNATKKHTDPAGTTQTKVTAPKLSSSADRYLWHSLLFAIAAGCVAWLGYNYRGHYFPTSVNQPQAPSPSSASQKSEALAKQRAKMFQQLEEKYNSFVPRPSLPFKLEPREEPEERITTADVEKRDAVHSAFKTSWAAYVSEAWGSDEYHPISHTGSNLSIDGGVGYTIIDALDTLLLFGEEVEYKRARDWVKDNLHGSLQKWEKRGRFNVFETVIRTLGGLLSAYALCTEHPSNIQEISSPFFKMCDPGDAQMFLETAEQLSNHLHPAFDTRTGIPKREVDFYSGKAFADQDNNGAASLAEATTVQMEFKYLSWATKENNLWALAERPMKAVREATRTGTQDGLLPIFLSPDTGQFLLSPVRLGSRGDSYYEYLIKQFVQTNRSEGVYRDMFDRAIAGVKKHLIKQSSFSDPPFVFTGEIIPRVLGRGARPVFKLLPKQDHLVCFLAGALMLSAHEYGAPLVDRSDSEYQAKYSEIASLQQEDWALGHELLRGCMTTYQDTTTGLAPEIAFWRAPTEPEGKTEDWYIKQAPPDPKGRRRAPLIDARNILRPETVESLFVAFHLSGDPIYREWGWEIFEAFEEHCKLPNGAYAGIKDVNANLSKIEHEDKMETFWLSETLKYLYLLFDDQSTLPLSQWVLNTEAHPLPIFVPTERTSFK